MRGISQQRVGWDLHNDGRWRVGLREGDRVLHVEKERRKRKEALTSVFHLSSFIN
jgi:hypothetical protein